MTASELKSRTRTALTRLALTAGVFAWLWPIGLGGAMPVGGDVTNFSLGLMGYLTRSLRAFRLPLWNHLWGSGFPGLAESQMGVFYPIHLILYGTLGTEAAYTISCIVHTLLGAFGVAWAARRFGISPVGGALAGFAWMGSGFFVVHLPHQWGYTTGAWMPWACGLAWSLIRGDRPGRSAALLAAVLAIQILPGHFQIAFITQVSVGVLLLTGVVERWRRGETVRALVIAATLGLAAVLPLSAMQLVPTFDLAHLAASQRDWSYLASFSGTPVHLINYIAPGLFRRSPLWRPLAWDAFHTSPEELLDYVGLVTLFLATLTLRKGVRTDRDVRPLLLLAGLALALSLGPYFPGFGILYRLPGFSFFRAPSRWTIASGLALCLLAGRGFDLALTAPRLKISLLRFSLIATALVLAMALLIEGAFQASEMPGPSGLKAFYGRAFAMIPWKDGPEYGGLMAEAHRPWDDFRAISVLVGEGNASPTPDDLTLSKNRHAILVRELAPSLILLAILAAMAPFAERRKTLATALIALSVADGLILVYQQKTIETIPLGPLIEKSPVLAEIGRRAQGGRVFDGTSNLTMLVGAGPMIGYRTLDLPAVPSLTALARDPLGNPAHDPTIALAWKMAGLELRVLDPFQVRVSRGQAPKVPGWTSTGIVKDPQLAAWIQGSAFVKANPSWASDFRLIEPDGPAVIAWFLPKSAVPAEAFGPELGQNPLKVLEVMLRATPLSISRDRPEVLRLKGTFDQPGWVIVSQLAHPSWAGDWTGSEGTIPAKMRTVFGGWQAIEVTEPGRASLRLRYRERWLIHCLAVSGLAWGGWLAFMGWSIRSGRERHE